MFKKNNEEIIYFQIMCCDYVKEAIRLYPTVLPWSIWLMWFLRMITLFALRISFPVIFKLKCLVIINWWILCDPTHKSFIFSTSWKNPLHFKNLYKKVWNNVAYNVLSSYSEFTSVGVWSLNHIGEAPLPVYKQVNKHV